MAKILCVGIAVADLITGSIREIPERGMLTVVDEMTLHTGGCAVNTAVDLARLGIDAAVNVLVGDDGLGDFISRELQKNGVDTQGVRRTGRSGTSSSMVLCDIDGERRFLHSIGANGIFSLEDIDEDLLAHCEILVYGGALLMPAFDGQPAAELLRKAKAMGKITMMDTAWNDQSLWMEVVQPCLPYVDYFVPSYDEAARLSGETDEKIMADFFLEAGAAHVVIKLGAEGCYIKHKEEEHILPAFPVAARDTTGAGDAFVAGFAAGLLNRWPLRKCGMFGNAVGAFCIGSVGASSGIEGYHHVLTWMEGQN